MDFMARLEQQMQAHLSRIPKPDAPTAAGLTVDEIITPGLQIGNADLADSCKYEEPGEPERVPQVYPTQGDMP